MEPGLFALRFRPADLGKKGEKIYVTDVRILAKQLARKLVEASVSQTDENFNSLFN